MQGPLWAHSCFVFEAGIGKIKKLITSAKGLPHQVMSRVLIANKVGADKAPASRQVKHFLCCDLRKEEAEGLVQFAVKVQFLYSKKETTSNVHLLLHLAKSASMQGPLWAHSCFVFEAGIGKIKKLITSAKGLPHQVMSRVLIANKVGADKAPASRQVKHFLCCDLRKEEAEGLVHFVVKVQFLYSKKETTSNVHLLLHLAKSPSMQGPLWAHSCFVFEAGIGKIKKLITSAKGMPHQAMSRVLIANKVGADKAPASRQVKHFLCCDLRKEEAEGLVQFAVKIQFLYSKKETTSNVHLLLHLAKSASMQGPLWAHSCFVFEAGIGKIKKLITSAKGLPHQVMSRVLIANKVGADKAPASHQVKHFLCCDLRNEDSLALLGKPRPVSASLSRLIEADRI
ncbi:uncharacterized protein LOC125944798 [Dermacentor silvarum]|uniref:uncharacterized protein LOC125944798 n=1 Tax=Dermacentor silvarum TaxID=543639 RepID=UPI0021008D36|nr:uncharacterized protein LOC125944798 [Dermacentor silvarum]